MERRTKKAPRASNTAPSLVRIVSVTGTPWRNAMDDIEKEQEALRKVKLPFLSAKEAATLDRSFSDGRFF